MMFNTDHQFIVYIAVIHSCLYPCRHFRTQLLEIFGQKQHLNVPMKGVVEKYVTMTVANHVATDASEHEQEQEYSVARMRPHRHELPLGGERRRFDYYHEHHQWV